jgi:glycosyltransferase involved in cell wall biosynthesis
VILSVIHTWKDRGWHYPVYAEATRDLPTRHVDHLNPGPEGPLDYGRILGQMRRCRVYYHDGENEYTVALVEAMMVGAPIVTCEMPFVERHVKHEINGFVSGDPARLREYCRLLLDDHDLAARMGAESRRLALERYHEDRWIRQWNDLFDRFLAGEKIVT